MESKETLSNKTQTKIHLRDNLAKLRDKECWGFAAGKGTGSHVVLSIGEKIPLAQPVDNHNLSENVRNNGAEFSLFIECVWRLDSIDEVICGAWDDNSKNEKMLEGLGLLINSKIVSIDISEPSLDLEIEFSNKLILKIFCDQTNEKDNFDNYSLITALECLTVGCKSKIMIEHLL